MEINSTKISNLLEQLGLMQEIEKVSNTQSTVSNSAEQNDMLREQNSISRENELQEFAPDAENFDPANPPAPYDIDAQGAAPEDLADALKKGFTDSGIDVSDNVLGQIMESASEIFDNLKSSAANPSSQADFSADAPEFTPGEESVQPDIDAAGSAKSAIIDVIINDLEDSGITVTDDVKAVVQNVVEDFMNNLKGSNGAPPEEAE